MNIKASLAALAAFHRLCRRYLAIPVNEKTECVPAKEMMHTMLSDGRKRRAPKRKPKPNAHHYARDINRLGARPKIVTSKEFPNKTNAVHYAPPKVGRIDHLMRRKYA